MQRFNDPAATVNPALVHTVEISEAHDARQFFTLWLKGEARNCAEWVAEHPGLVDRHDPAIYHVGAGNYGWMPAVYPQGPADGWSKHYHVDTPDKPVWADFAPYLDQIPEALQNVVYAAVGGHNGPAPETVEGDDDYDEDATDLEQEPDEEEEF